MTSLSRSEILNATFKKYDADGNGDISVEELKNVLTRLNPKFTVEVCKRLFNEMDVNNDGSVQYKEFLDFILKNEGPDQGVKAAIALDKDKAHRASVATVDEERRRKLRGKFANLDVNGDGALSFVEIYTFLYNRYPNMTPPDLRFLYECADKSEDGVIDFYELLDLLVTVPAGKVPSAEKTQLPEGSPAPLPEFAHPLFAPMREKDKQSYEKAVVEYEEDQRRLMTKAMELEQALKKVKDDNKKHNAFRDEHAKAMREFYAKNGHN